MAAHRKQIDTAMIFTRAHFVNVHEDANSMADVIHPGVAVPPDKRPSLAGNLPDDRDFQY
jgi:hypothetical protein